MGLGWRAGLSQAIRPGRGRRLAAGYAWRAGGSGEEEDLGSESWQCDRTARKEGFDRLDLRVVSVCRGTDVGRADIDTGVGKARAGSRGESEPEKGGTALASETECDSRQ